MAIFTDKKLLKRVEILERQMRQSQISEAWRLASAENFWDPKYTFYDADEIHKRFNELYEFLGVTRNYQAPKHYLEKKKKYAGNS